MALDDRRSVLVGGAAGLAGLWLPQAATAKDVVKANPAPAGVTVGIFEHGTPSYTKWRKVLDGFIDPETGQVALPPDQKTIRIIYAKVPKGENAEEGVLACQVFLDDGLPGVQKFFNQDKAKGGPESRPHCVSFSSNVLMMGWATTAISVRSMKFSV